MGAKSPADMSSNRAQTGWVRVDIDGTERGLSSDVEAVALRTAEAQVGDDFENRDATDQRPVRSVETRTASALEAQMLPPRSTRNPSKNPASHSARVPRDRRKRPSSATP